MDEFASNLINFVEFFSSGFRLVFRSSLYFGVGGVFIFIWCFRIYWKHLGRENISSIRKFWMKFAIKEAFYVLVASFNNIAAIFVLAYSLINGGTLLLATAKRTSSKIDTILGNFLARLVPILGILTLLVLIGFGNKYQWETIAVSTAFGIILIRGIKYTQWQSISDYLSHFQRNLWHRTPRMGKVALIACLAAVPCVFYGLFYTHVYAYSWDYMVPMRDGIHLRTRVYYPPLWTGDARPVVMIRTAYKIDSAQFLNYVWQFTTDLGYIVVEQDIRGTGGSEGGVFPVYLTDAADGVDTINWLTEQPWCSGKIATVGSSGDACNQICYQAEGPTGLFAAYLHAGPAELYDQWIYPGGCFRKEFLEHWLSSFGFTEQYNLLLAHPEKSDFWRPASLTMDKRYENVSVRAVHLGGWYDCFAQGTIDTFTFYNSLGKSYARDHQILVMGPYTHGYPHPDATYPNDTIGFQFAANARSFIFEESLKGISYDWTAQPRVYYYVMGDNTSTDPRVNEWRTSMQWPVAGLTSEAWYFHPDGVLNTTAPLAPGNLSYLFNPANPVPNGGGTTYSLIQGARDNALIEAGRSDILKFTTQILTNPVEIIGRLNASLQITSNCTDTDFTAKLLDIYPDGRQIIVASGILKTRYRNGFEPMDVALMAPGQVYDLAIDLWSTAYRFTQGHRIRISISSSNYPEFAVNDNTGGAVTATLGPTYNVANNTLLCGAGATPSSIWFPRSA